MLRRGWGWPRLWPSPSCPKAGSLHTQNHPRAFGDGADGARPQGTQPLTESVGCVWGQHGCPRPCVLAGPQVLMPARTRPSSGHTWGTMLRVLRVPCPTAGRVKSPESGPRLSNARAASLPNPWAWRRQTPTSQAAPVRAFSSSPRAVVGQGGVASSLVGGSAQDPTLVLSPSQPPLPTQTTQLTRVYKAHWLKGTELSEKINPTTRHI